MIELVDAAERIEALLPMLDEIVTEGLITAEGIRIVAYRHGGAPG